MSVSQSVNAVYGQTPKRFVSLDFCRGLAIFLMILLHIIQRILNYDEMLANINDQAIINLLALVLVPFFGGLAGFFLIISSISNMVSMNKDLERGVSIKGLVLKQIIGGFLLLIFAMLCEGLTGYLGLFGFFTQNLNNPLNTDWHRMLWNWNNFETIHTIAWCVILNGCVQGLLSLKGNWQNKNKMIIAYIILAFVIISWTQPVWNLVSLVGPGYPFGHYPSGHQFYLPWIGTESFWDILKTPFLNALASPLEPLFPYLAVSFIGSAIGIYLSKPQAQITRKFPRNLFYISLTMFLGGLIWVVIVLIQVVSTQGFDIAVEQFYMAIVDHRAWSNDYKSFIPPFSWLGQFLAVNGFSLLVITLILRLVEFRGISKVFADKSRIIRRFGIVAFSNYNNQWIFFIVFCFTSFIITRVPYQKLDWGGTFLTIIITYLIYSLLLYGWEKIRYFGSFEYIIRTIAYNVVPVRRQSFTKPVKWWKRGLVDVDKSFYNANWINLVDKQEEKEGANMKAQANKVDSRFAFRLSIISLCSILFILLTFISLIVAIKSIKKEGKNNQNTAAIIISSIAIILIITFVIVGSLIPIGVLGIF